MRRRNGFKKSEWLKRKSSVALAALAFAILGVLMLHASHAATFASGGEAESGTVSGNASTVSDTNASGGSAVKFGNSGSGSGCSLTATPFCWPTSVSSNGRYLLDQTGKPYMIVGDSPQNLIGDLTEAEAGTYFTTRQSQGFNAAWINLLCADYTSCNSDGTTYDGIAPFNGTASNPFASPNPAYFQRVDDMVNLAAAHGISVFLDPAETGSFLGDIDQAGATNDFNYGVYLGNRYKNFPNIIWQSGNDFQTWSNATDDANVSAIAKGIKSADPNQLQTVELNYHASSSLDDQNWANIIKLNATYTYYPTYAELYHAYGQTPTIPAYMVEANYEYGNLDGQGKGTPFELRLQEYWTMTSGATGQLYGNHYTWNSGTNWSAEQSHLISPGAQQINIMQAFFNSIAWYKLVPDQNHAFVTAGYGTFSSTSDVDSNDYVTATLAPDGSLGVIYVPTNHTVTVNTSKMSGSFSAKWFDPTTGNYIVIDPLANSGGSMQYTSPGVHSDGSDDWVLILQAT